MSDAEPPPVAQRIPVQGPHEWSTAAREMFAFGEGPEAYDNGSAYKVMNTFAHHPELMLAWIKFNGRLLRAPKLDPKVRELIILRIAWRYQVQYEWVQHVIEGGTHGIGAEHIEAVKTGWDNLLWSDVERAALRAADKMVDNGRLDDDSWEAVAKHLDHQQQFEFIFTVGAYTILAWMFNVIRITPESTYIEQANAVAPGSGTAVPPPS